MLIGILEISNRIPLNDLLLNLKGEHRPLAIFTLDLKMASHHIKEALGNGHAKSCAFNISVCFFINAFKSHKEPFKVFRFYAYTGIFNTDLKPDKISLIRDLITMYGEGYMSLFRIFYGIGEDIDYNLLDHR